MILAIKYFFEGSNFAVRFNNSKACFGSRVTYGTKLGDNVSLGEFFDVTDYNIQNYVPVVIFSLWALGEQQTNALQLSQSLLLT